MTKPDFKAMRPVEPAAAKKKSPIESLTTEGLGDVKHIIAIASGKGGVGKSTIAVNLAVALALEGFNVGLADADIYGPSIPTMTGTEGVRPQVEEGQEEGKEVFIPIEKYGVKWMSIGYFANREQALIWRGPMASNALKQLVLQTKWGALDFLLIDLPPGTGDVHISLMHDIPLSGGVVVSTPQQVAVADVEKCLNMFLHPELSVPVFGLVENMAWFTPEELPNNRYYLFGKGGTQALGEKYHLPVLAQIPLVQGICDRCDNGIPVANEHHPAAEAFRELARTVANKTA